MRDFKKLRPNDRVDRVDHFIFLDTETKTVRDSDSIEVIENKKKRIEELEERLKENKEIINKTSTQKNWEDFLSLLIEGLHHQGQSLDFKSVYEEYAHYFRKLDDNFYKDNLKSQNISWFENFGKKLLHFYESLTDCSSPQRELKNTINSISPDSVHIDKNVVEEKWIKKEIEELEEQLDKIEIEDEEVQKLNMGYAEYWNRRTDRSVWCYFESPSYLFDFIEKIVQDKEKVYIYAHNMDFDFKIIEAFKQLTDRGWEFDDKRFSIQPCAFMIMCKKDDTSLSFLDTGNYVRRMPLEKLGEYLGIPKMDVNPMEEEDKEKLKEYCRRDVEIVHEFIETLLKFIDQNGTLSELKPTISSLALNTFRHSFYDYQEKPIFLHGWKAVENMEISSYKGGLTDVFRWGKYGDTELYKLDVNSMYPHIMKEKKLPYKLDTYFHRGNHNRKPLMDILKEKLYEEHKDIIAWVKIKIPPELGFVLKRCQINGIQKTLRLGGEFWNCITTPELRFIDRHGEIKDIEHLAVYDSMTIFDDYVDYFYEIKQEYDREDNRAFYFITKTFMNSLYGKFGQRERKTLETKEVDHFDLRSEIWRDEETGESKRLIQIGNKMFTKKKTDNPSKFSFVGLASLISAHGRMLLTDMILEAGPENVFYTDTDSLIVNRKGFKNLKDRDLLDPDQLGKLDLEGHIEADSRDSAEFYGAKNYRWNGKETIKGVKPDAIKVREDEKSILFRQEEFESLKKALKNERPGKQIIKKDIPKEISKIYTKGRVLEDGRTLPFEVNT